MNGTSKRKLQRMVVTEDGPWQVQLLMREIQNPTAACRALVSQYFQPFYQTLIQVIREVAEEPLEDSVARQLAMSVIGQCMIYRFAPVTRAMMMDDPMDLEAAPGSAAGHRPSPDLNQLGDLITHFSLAGILAAARNIIAKGPASPIQQPVPPESV